MPTKDRNLVLFSETEKFALYAVPDFDDKQRREYFSFSENELHLIMHGQHLHVNIYCALQIGYFKAKKIFFQLSWKKIISEDLQFILSHYFPGMTFTGMDITRYQYYNQRKEIANLFCYRLWSKEFMSMLHKQAIQIIKRDTSPNFIAHALVIFLDNIKVVRPAYTTLQVIVTKSLVEERRRISAIIDKELGTEHKTQLDQLLIHEDNVSKLAGFKQDAKNFGFKMMLRERQKHNTLEPLYQIAIKLLPKLEISRQNIDNYVNLANHYTIRDLRELKYNQGYLYILCYVLKRYQQLNDNLIEAFIYHFKKINKTIQDRVSVHFTDDVTESQEKIGDLLLLYVDEQFNDTTLFTEVQDCAFKIMPKDIILDLGNKMLNKPRRKKEFKWQEVDKLHKTCKKNLRPLFMKLGFSSEDANNPWLKSAYWLQEVFANNQKLHDRPYHECIEDTIPKHLQRYLLNNDTPENRNLNSGRYEYWIYSQISKQIYNGGLYIENSFNHRCFNHELVPVDQKRDILNDLNIPWLQLPIQQHLDDLTKELHDLWLLFNKNLKQNKFSHLKYDYRKQKLNWNKIKANKNEKLQNKFFKQLPFCDISDLLIFVNDNCRFMSAFTPLQPRYFKHDADNKEKLIATILAQAFNHGNYKMSQVSDVSYRSLETIYQQYLRLSTLKKANDIISNSISRLPIFPYYSLDLELLYSSVDGQKFELDTPNIKARYSRKYLREGQGVSAYTILANHVPLQCELIGSHEHESYYAFDIWYNNTSDIIPDTITGDMHVTNKANFAITKWFGVQLNPRFTNLNAQLKNLYCADNIVKYSNCLVKPVSQINLKVIVEQKSNIDQLVATLALKDISQANLIKKLCHLPSENPLRKAVFEYDKLIRSIYTLKYMMNVQLQKNIHKSQNRIESYHKLRAAIAKVGGKKQLYGKTDIDIEISNQCGRLIANAIIYYNSIILSGILGKYGIQPGNKKALTIIRKISPVAWHQHIHFLGQYTFQNKSSTINIKQILENIDLL
ncbi:MULTISPECIES: Tn3 family transposase [unclassified Rickettsia]|uniref:Tn3 family transposase n=1 Tax=unclassified Rickettsia TaxID=114295 RepID=UPI0031334A49